MTDGALDRSQGDSRTITPAFQRWLEDEAYTLDQALTDGMTDDEYCLATEITPEEWARYRDA